MSAIQSERWFVVHMLVERSQIISRGTAMTWVEPVVLEDDEGVKLFTSRETACSFVKSEEMYNLSGGYDIKYFEIHEVFHVG